MFLGHVFGAHDAAVTGILDRMDICVCGATVAAFWFHNSGAVGLGRGGEISPVCDLGYCHAAGGSK